MIVSSIAGVIIGLKAGLGAVSGIITNYFLGSHIASLSPFIIGGIIGFGLPLLVVGFLLSLISNPSLGDSIKKVPKLIIDSCPEFGIGMGLVALGFTSPAAIGALSFTIWGCCPCYYCYSSNKIYS